MGAPAVNRAELVDVREARQACGFEVRSDTDEIKLTGYASTFEPYEMYGGPERGGWLEQMDRRAFDKTLRERPDVVLVINHFGAPLARTKSGTLSLSVDAVGLRVEAQLDRQDPDAAGLARKMRRGDMDEMSFAFRVKSQIWSAAKGFDDPQSHRLITEVNLHKGDVSVVNWGANPTTHAEVLSRSRKKKPDGQRGTLSAAEAIALTDGTRRTRRLTVAEARAIIAADRATALLRNMKHVERKHQ